MLPKHFLNFLFASTVAFHLVHADTAKDSSDAVPTCSNNVHPMRVSMRHIEGKGVGYDQGYSTLEGFFSPVNPWKNVWTPFLDVRGHVFNNGKMAANAGVGVRYLASRVWGMNSYYDYRNTNHQHYNQVSLGFESLGRIWDFRVNGYLPVGDKTSSSYHRKFSHFEGHHMIVSQKKEFAMKGANAEVGAHVDSIKNVPFYFAAGPYYLNGQGKSAWGGQLRAAVDLYTYVRLEGNTSYDHLFKWIGQGQLTVNIPFGGRKVIKQRKGYSCSQELTFRERSVQRVDRNEIIPVDSKRHRSTAINPATGDPYVFWFVDNTSSSAGTFKSPYPTLLQAQVASSPYDIIYVFQGDGTATGMDSGIVMQGNQELLGSGNTHRLQTSIGSITIPTFTNGMPLLTNLGGNTVTLENSNTISGIHFDNAMTAIFGSSINNVKIENNQFTSSVVQTSVGLTNASGHIKIYNNSFATSVVDVNSNGIFIDNTDVSATISVTDNSFDNHGGFGIFVGMKGASNHHITIASNTLIAPIGFESTQGGPFPPGPGPNGIRIQGADTSFATVSIDKNVCLYHEVLGITVFTAGTAFINSSVVSNTLQPGTIVPITGSAPSAGIIFEAYDDSVQNCLVTGNTVSATKNFGIGFVNFGTATCNVDIYGNRVSDGGQGPGPTIFGGGIGIFVNGEGDVNARVMRNVLTRNLQEGGVTGFNINISGTPSQGTLCLSLKENTSDTGYVLYNPPLLGTAPINLEEGYQTNVGTINFVPSSSSTIPPLPAASIPPGAFFGDGGEITIVPSGFCE